MVAAHTAGYPRFLPDSGTVAVAVFFFISGFLMPLSLNGNYLSRNTSYAGASGRFLLNRLLRIFPLYWLSLIILVGYSLVRPPPEAVRQAFEHPVIFLQNFLLLGLNQSNFWGQYVRFNNVAWTLDVELQYYLLVPLLVWLWHKFRVVTVIAVLTASVSGLVLLALPSDNVDIDRSILPWFPLFLAGFSLYQIKWLKKLFDSGNAIAVGLVISISGLLFLQKGAATVLVTAGMILIGARLLVMQERGGFSRLDARLGDLSYPLFILHLLILGFTESRTAIPIAAWIDNHYLRFAMQTLVNVVLSSFASYVALIIMDDRIRKLRSTIKAWTTCGETSAEHRATARN